MDAPAETAPAPEQDTIAEYTEERAQIRHEMDGAKLLIKQTEQELTRLGDKKQEVADEVAAIEERLQHHTRDEIREIYLRSNETEMRVFMIKEELDKLKAKLKTTERYEAFLTRAIETLSTLPSPEQTQAAMDSDFFGVLTSGTLPPFLRDMAQRIATGDLPPKDTSAPPAGGIAPSLGQAASTRAVQAQEEVRARVAQQLHTTIMQGLVNLALATEICEKLVRTDPAASLDELSHLKDLINATVQQASKTMLALRPLALEGQGLTATIQRFATTLAGEKGIPLTFSAPHAERKLAPDASVAVFRVAQEALENAVRHSEATEVRVTVAFVPNGLSVTVEDDGVGVDVEQAMARAVQHQSAGIMGMLERAEMLGGWLRFESNPGKGTSVELYAPL
jgi:signal transduction histidine kinase